MSLDNAEEEPWSDKFEEYFANIGKLCKYNAKLNEEASYHFKGKKNLWGLPSVLWPGIMAPIVTMVGWSKGDDCNTITSADYLSTASLIISFMLSGIVGYYGFGEKMIQCEKMAVEWGGIAADIDEMLCRDRKFRLPADVFLTKIGMRVGYANGRNITLPKSIIHKVEKDMKCDQEILSNNVFENVKRYNTNKKTKDVQMTIMDDSNSVSSIIFHTAKEEVDNEDNNEDNEEEYDEEYDENTDNQNYLNGSEAVETASNLLKSIKEPEYN